MLLVHFTHYQSYPRRRTAPGGTELQKISQRPPRSHFTPGLQVRTPHLWEANRLSATPPTAAVQDQRTQTSTHSLNLTCQPHAGSILLLSTTHSSQLPPSCFFLALSLSHHSPVLGASPWPGLQTKLWAGRTAHRSIAAGSAELPFLPLHSHQPHGQHGSVW